MPGSPACSWASHYQAEHSKVPIPESDSKEHIESGLSETFQLANLAFGPTAWVLIKMWLWDQNLWKRRTELRNGLEGIKMGIKLGYLDQWPANGAL